jgi:hypothetical protein|tara:strand:+ start:121 stop:615 length:495 start_codon:yes stop_codon:yes gene_type:complete
MASRKDAQELFFTILPEVIAGISDNPRPIDEILRVHLLTEAVLEKIIDLVLGVNSEAVLAAKLSYVQKLLICGNLKFEDSSSVLSSDVMGSLRKLNTLRNDVAHNLSHETSEEDVESLFVGSLGAGRNQEVVNGDVWIKLSSYKAMIYSEILDPGRLKKHNKNM